MTTDIVTTPHADTNVDSAHDTSKVGNFRTPKMRSDEKEPNSSAQNNPLQLPKIPSTLVGHPTNLDQRTFPGTEPIGDDHDAHTMLIRADHFEMALKKDTESSMAFVDQNSKQPMDQSIERVADRINNLSGQNVDERVDSSQTMFADVKTS